MAFQQLYLCRKCETWQVCNPERSLKGCSCCKGKLEYVPVNINQYQAMSQIEKEAFQREYLSSGASVNAESIDAGIEESEETPKTTVGGAVKNGCSYTFFRVFVFPFLCLLILFVYNTSSKWLRQYDFFQKPASVSVNEMMTAGADWTDETYVELEARWPLGSFATQTSSSTVEDMEIVSGIDYFYYLYLEDETLIAVQTCNASEIKRLNRMSEWLFGVDGFPEDGETITLRGELKEMQDPTLRKYYRESIPIAGMTGNSPEVRMLVLDTTEGRYGIVVFAAVILAAGILLIVNHKRKKKKKEEWWTPADGSSQNELNA